MDSSVGRRCVVVVGRSLSNDGSQPTGNGPKSGTEVKLPKPPQPPRFSSSSLPLAAASRSPCPKETERRTADGGRADAFAPAERRPAGGNCKQNPPAEAAWEKRGSSLVPVAAAGLRRALQSGGRRGREASEARELWEELVLLSPRSTECWRRNRDLSGKINYLCTFDLYGPVHNCFDAGRYIMWGGGGRGVGAGNREFLGPLK